MLDRSDVREVLEDVAGGRMSVDDAIDRLKLIPFEDLGFAKVDHHRSIRQGVPEVVYGAGKTVEQIVAIAESMLNQGSGSVLVTRITEDTASEIARSLPIEYDPSSRIGVVGSIPGHEGVGKIVVVSAGTSDIPVAEEAAVTAEFLGSKVTRIYDAGVAGIHRLLAHSEDLLSARVVVAVAGMEGALPSVIGGLVECPVIAVPTSVGYGASFGGLSALLTMLNSCASGISVVNIDNGFGAGFLADRINRMESP